METYITYSKGELWSKALNVCLAEVEASDPINGRVIGIEDKWREVRNATNKKEHASLDEAKEYAHVMNQLSTTKDQEKRTDIFVQWLQAQDDDVKQRFALNWRIPHSLFNIASKFFNSADIQNINWYRIFKNKSSLTWSHGGAIY